MNYLSIPRCKQFTTRPLANPLKEIRPRQFKKVQQKNWSAPIKNEWVNVLRTTIEEYHSPMVLVAHSLGCIAVAHRASEKL